MPNCDHCTHLSTMTCILLPDSTLTIKNVMQALATMPYDFGFRLFSTDLGVPGPILHNIERAYPTSAQRKQQVAEYYLRYAPGASWSHLAGWLHYNGQQEALQHIQRYVQRPAGMMSLVMQCIPITNTDFTNNLFLSGYAAVISKTVSQNILFI